MYFKLYNSDCGVTIRGVNYDFDHVDNVGVDDPERVRLTRGANASNKTGLVYKEGSKEAKKLTFTVLGLGKELFDLLTDVYNKEERVEAYAVDRSDGSSKIAKKAILSNAPQQLTLDDTPESMNVVLEFETFDLSEKHKS